MAGIGKAPFRSNSSISDGVGDTPLSEPDGEIRGGAEGGGRVEGWTKGIEEGLG